MATLAKWFTKGLMHALSDVNVKTDTIKAAIYDTAPDQDLDEFLTDVAGEVTGTGYTAGGKTVTNFSLTVDTSTNKTTIDCDDLSWASSTITGRYLIFYKSTGTAATSPLLWWQDAGAEISSSGGSWDFIVDATGLAQATAA
jgi:hypothetical protein